MPSRLYANSRIRRWSGSCPMIWQKRKLLSGERSLGTPNGYPLPDYRSREFHIALLIHARTNYDSFYRKGFTRCVKERDIRSFARRVDFLKRRHPSRLILQFPRLNHFGGKWDRNDPHLTFFEESAVLYERSSRRKRYEHSLWLGFRTVKVIVQKLSAQIDELGESRLNWTLVFHIDRLTYSEPGPIVRCPFRSKHFIKFRRIEHQAEATAATITSPLAEQAIRALVILISAVAAERTDIWFREGYPAYTRKRNLVVSIYDCMRQFARGIVQPALASGAALDGETLFLSIQDDFSAGRHERIYHQTSCQDDFRGVLKVGEVGRPQRLTRPDPLEPCSVGVVMQFWMRRNQRGIMRPRRHRDSAVQLSSLSSGAFSRPRLINQSLRPSRIAAGRVGFGSGCALIQLSSACNCVG